MKLSAVVLSILVGFTMACPHKLEARDIFATLETRTPGDAADWTGAFNAWRIHCNIPTVTADAQLTANAQKAAQNANGQLKHTLYPGTRAQLLTRPLTSGDNEFTDMFIGGWLCEVPTACGLQGRCSFSPYNLYSHNGDTGHYQIVANGGYRRLGCAKYNGLWVCDLA